MHLTESAANMSSMLGISDIARIHDLLQEEKIDDDDTNDQVDHAAVKKLYGTGKEKKEGYEKPFKAVVKGNQQKDAKDIWESEDVPESAAVIEEEEEDDREEPEYEVLYKQSVGAEDVYMNMGFKDPSSMSCDTMIIKINLPGEPMAKVDLEITPESLLLRSPKFKLYLDLPRKVDDKKGKAEFDRKKSELRLTFPIIQRSMRQVLEEDY